MFPKYAVGAVVGIGCLSGAIGSVIFSTSAGHILQATGSYWSLFLMSGFAYLVGWLIIHLLVPRMEPVQLVEP